MSLLGKRSPPVCTAVNDFFRKVLRLAAVRLLEMGNHLQVTASETVTQQVVSALRFALYERTSLFYNRHLDQVLMCTVYGVCKVNRLPLSFRELTVYYTRHVQGQRKVYTTIVLKQTNPELWVRDMSREQLSELRMSWWSLLLYLGSQISRSVVVRSWNKALGFARPTLETLAAAIL